MTSSSTVGRELDRTILRLALPALGSLIAEPLYLLVDTAVVGHLGTAELGGVAIANSLIGTIYALFIFLAYGTTSAVARLLGAGESKRAVVEGVQGLWQALAIGMGAAVGCFFFAEPLVGLFGASDAVQTHAITYLRVSCLGFPALFFTLAGTGYVRGTQNTRLPFTVAVWTNVLNLILEVWWIYGLGFGVGASALATVLAQSAGAAWYLRVITWDARGAGVSLGADPTAMLPSLRVGADLS